jgi:virginiamycin B lyase
MSSAISRRRLWSVLAVLAVVAAAVSAVPASAATPTITEYGPLPTPAAVPCETEFDRNGILWIEEQVANKIGRLDTATGTFTEHPIPTPLGYPGGMDPNPDGGIWFTEVVGNKIGRIDITTNVITEYTIPWGNALTKNLPYGIAVSDDIATGPDGALWFTLNGINAIGRIDPVTKAMTKYPLPTPGALPLIIQPGPGNTMVFGETLGNRIGTIDVTTKAIREYPVQTPASFTQGVTTAPDGTIWFTETIGQKIGTINPVTGAVREIPIPAITGGGLLGTGLLPLPGPIRLGSNGKVYFTEGNLALSVEGAIGEYDPAMQKFATHTTPTPLAGPCDLNAAHPGEMWFGENTANKIGKLTY